MPSFPPAGPLAGQLFNGPFTNKFAQKGEAYSGFASGRFKLTSAFSLAGGIRYTHEIKNATLSRTNGTPVTIWNTIANPPFDATPLRHRSNFLDGNVSLEYNPQRGVMFYVSASHGSKAGGFVETNTIATPPPLLVAGKVPAALVAAGSAIADESVWSYETGLKSTLFDRRLRFNLTGFIVDVTNFQDTLNTGGSLGFFTYNASARSRGVEVETVFQVTSGLHVGASATLSYAKSQVPLANADGSQLLTDASGNSVYKWFRRSQAPTFVLNADAGYNGSLVGSLDWSVSAALRYRSSMYNQLALAFPSRALTTIDLGLGVQSKDNRWGLDLMVRNLANQRAEDFAYPSADPRYSALYGAYVASPTPSRTVMLTARSRF